jgi:hypothetical protein
LNAALLFNGEESYQLVKDAEGFLLDFRLNFRVREAAGHRAQGWWAIWFQLVP